MEQRPPNVHPVDKLVEEQMDLPPMDSARYPVIDGRGWQHAYRRVTDQDGGLMRKLLEKLLHLCGGRRLTDPVTRRLRQ